MNGIFLESAIAAGVDILTYWDLTISEISVYIDVYMAKQKAKQQWEAQLAYTNAMLVGVSVGNIFSQGKGKIPTLHQIFPTLFEEEQPQQQDWRIAKERLMKYANAHNAKRGETE